MTHDLLFRRARNVTRPPGREERWDAGSVRLAEPNDQQPGCRLSDGFGFPWSTDQLYIKSGLFCRLQRAGSQSAAAWMCCSLWWCVEKTVRLFSVCNGTIVKYHHACLQEVTSPPTHLPATPTGCSCKIDGLRNDTLVESAPGTKTTHADRCSSYTILLTTGQQKSSHASDKGA